MRAGLCLVGLSLLIARTSFSEVLEVDRDVGDAPAVWSAREAKPGKKRFSPPYRRSKLIYRNIVSALSFDKGAEQTYNPYYAMELEIAPRFWTGEHGYFKLDIDLIKELTDSDVTTEQGEVVLNDIYLEPGLYHILRVPGVGIDVSTTLRLYAPTSKVSRARTLRLAIRPMLALERSFDVLDGLVFLYDVSLKKGFHESTTAETELPLIEDPLGSTRSKESFSNTGVRNVSFEVANSFGLVLGLSDWLDVLAKVWVINGFLYEDQGADDPRISYEPQEAEERRYDMAYVLELTLDPGRALDVALGLETVNPQLAPDSTYEKPFINRYTAVYLDLRLDVAGLVSSLASTKEKR